MQISEAWLREWVNPNIDTDTLVAQLTMAGLEVDGTLPAAGDFTGVKVGEITACEAHPDASKLQVCEVNVGEAEPLSIVCGAPNARVGIRVPVATIGAVLPKNFKIKRAKLRGVESFGMLCGADELGAGENSDGLWELPGDAPIGTDLREYLSLDDTIVDIDLTPNRGDCLSIRGIAREVGVINKVGLCEIEFAAQAPQIDDTFDVVIDEPKACPHYVGRVIKGVDLSKPSPVWMVERLRRSGVRSIDPVVDVTNYVMLELGQPMHAFDLATLSESIRVRFAKANEPLTLLDGKSVELTDDTLVIADNERVLAMAGVMGGENSGVSANTCDIFLECAHFDPITIAGKARNYGMHTDSSHRFERGVDPALQVNAIERATALLLSAVGGAPGPLVQAGAAAEERAAILLRKARIERVLGFSLADTEVEDILTRLGMSVDSQAEGWQVIPPSYRFDIALEVDLIEELGRLYGYNQLPTQMPMVSTRFASIPESRQSLQRFKNALVDRGYHEIIAYSFVDAESNALLDPEQTPIALANPISEDLAVMRTSLWPGLVKAALYNQNRQQSRIRLFESGLRFRGDVNDADQKPVLGGLLMGPVKDESWADENRDVDFFDAKGDLESVFALAGGAGSFSFESAGNEHPALHPGQAARVLKNGEFVGYLGALHPKIEDSLGFKSTVYLFELLLEKIQDRGLPSFKGLSKYPEVSRDVAVLVKASVAAADLAAAIRTVVGQKLVDLVVFDVYQGANLANDEKSIGFRLVLQDAEQTLTDEAVTGTVASVVTELKERFGATLRE